MKKSVKNKTNSTTQNNNNNINKDQLTNQSQQTIPRPKPHNTHPVQNNKTIRTIKYQSKPKKNNRNKQEAST